MLRDKYFRLKKILIVFVAFFFACVLANAEPKTKLENINVFAVVSKNIEQSFIDAAKLLKQEEGLEAFPVKGYQVHCTLYLTMYPAGLKDELTEKVKKLASQTNTFEVSTAGLEITSGNWFFMSIEPDENLQNLSNQVVRILSPLRSSSDFVPDWAKAFPNKVEYIKKYGSPNVLKEFNPHLTFLSSSNKEKLERFVENHKNSSFAGKIEGEVVGIGLGKADKNGQISEVWHIFPLNYSNSR
jgi:2'-5' RNA ligase